MKFATKAAARAKRLRKQARIRFAIFCVCGILLLGGLITLCIVHFMGIRSNYMSPVTITHGSGGGHTSVQSQINFKPDDSPDGNLPIATKTSEGSDESGGSSEEETVTGVAGTKVQTLPLNMSPSSITVYSNTSNAPGVKASIADTALSLSSENGQSIEEPYILSTNSPVTMSGTNGAAKTSWPMYMSTDSATTGQYTVVIAASSTNGNVYTGDLQVNIIPVPTFTITSKSDIYATVNRGTTTTADFSDLGYSLGAGAPAPTATASDLNGTNITCSGGISFNLTDLLCTDPNISSLQDGTAIIEFTFQNQFQSVTIAGGLIVKD